MWDIGAMEENLRFSRRCRKAAAYQKGIGEIVGDLWDIMEFEDPYCPRRALITRSGQMVMVREKFRRRNYRDILVETKKPNGDTGWVWDGETHALLYTIVPTETTFFVPMDLLMRVTALAIVQNGLCDETAGGPHVSDTCPLSAELGEFEFVEEFGPTGLRTGLVAIPLDEILGREGVRIGSCRGLLSEIRTGLGTPPPSPPSCRPGHGV